MKRILLIIAAVLVSAAAFSQETIRHPWYGAKVAFMGDSITDPGSVPDKHDWTGKTDSHYWGWLQEWLDIKPFVYGVSGRTWEDVPNQARQLKDEHGDDFDAITIFLGTNDFANDVPIGEWYEVKPEETTATLGYPATKFLRMKRTPYMDNKTLKGRINIAVSTLKSMFPEKQIVILTPIHRGFSTFGPQNIQPEESFPNRLGYYFSEYADVVKEAGNVWGIPVIDLNSLSGLNPMVEEQVVYFSNPETDKLHPNGKGHERIARTLMYQLLVLPCRF
ncbi:MAG: SGNH/GDSL hydrolase family protein [Bacteroidales bacterium]|nr:SGNH/GDSL hydrolase family protein [Bacteroidales bacterium]